MTGDTRRISDPQKTLAFLCNERAQKFRERAKMKLPDRPLFRKTNKYLAPNETIHYFNIRNARLNRSDSDTETALSLTPKGENDRKIVCISDDIEASLPFTKLRCVSNDSTIVETDDFLNEKKEKN
jgi:hypothetical protein